MTWPHTEPLAPVTHRLIDVRHNEGDLSDFTKDAAHLGRPVAFDDIEHGVLADAWEHINLTGDYQWEAEESLNPEQFRPLQTRLIDLAMAA